MDWNDADSISKICKNLAYNQSLDLIELGQRRGNTAVRMEYTRMAGNAFAKAEMYSDDAGAWSAWAAEAVLNIMTACGCTGIDLGLMMKERANKT